MIDGAAFHSTSSTPGPDPLRSSRRPKRLWSQLLYGAARADLLLSPTTKLVAQHLAWRADAIRADELFASCALVGQLLERSLGRVMSRGEAQRHLLALQGDPRGFRGGSRHVVHLVYLERVPQPGKPGGRTRNWAGETVSKANRFRLGPAALAAANRLLEPTPGESVDNNVVVAASSWRLPTPKESLTPGGARIRSHPPGDFEEEAGSAGRLVCAGARAHEPALSSPGTPAADEVPPARGPVPPDHPPASGLIDGLPATAAQPTAEARDGSPEGEVGGLAAVRAAVERLDAEHQARERQRVAAQKAEWAEQDRRRAERRAEHRRSHPVGCTSENCTICYAELICGCRESWCGVCRHLAEADQGAPS